VSPTRKTNPNDPVTFGGAVTHLFKPSHVRGQAKSFVVPELLRDIR